jgi:hypothetical protein
MSIANDQAEAEPIRAEPKTIPLSYLQLAFERTYKGDVGKGNSSILGVDTPEQYAHQFSKRKNGTYKSDRLQNIFQGFCLALQSINDASISFSDVKTGNL